MASTDTRSGFRLPWSSDRSHDEASDDVTTEPTQDAEAHDAQPEDFVLPEPDLHARLGIADSEPRSNNDPRPPEEWAEKGPIAEEPPLMVDINAAPSAPPATPRKPSKLMADLSAAIRSTAETAREQALAQTDTTLRQVVETIREQSTEGATQLRQQSDEDIAGIRDWSKAEIARIREETDRKITARKSALEDELSDHAASVDRQIEDVQAEVARYQAHMDAYLERVRNEDDPASLATLAESMPDVPSFEAWVGTPADEATDDVEVAAEAAAGSEAVEGQAEAIEADAAGTDVEPATGRIETADEAAKGQLDAATPAGDTAPGEGEPEAPAEDEAGAQAAQPAIGVIEPAVAVDDLDPSQPVTSVDDGTTDPDVVGETETEPARSRSTAARIAWGDASGDWTTPPPPKAEGDVSADAVGSAPRWAAAEASDGTPTTNEAGELVDHDPVMAAVEAAAEAVAGSESAASPVDQADAAAGAAETMAERFRGDQDTDDPGEAMSALEARVEAGGFEAESFTGRLASLLPGHGGGADGEPQASQVIVSGLISVASIASFKRHLSRIAGVQSVTVASGPDGEFVFNVDHGPDVVFRDVIPTMPGFAARVISSEDGVVHVNARDPETES